MACGLKDNHRHITAIPAQRRRHRRLEPAIAGAHRAGLILDLDQQRHPPRDLREALVQRRNGVGASAQGDLFQSGPRAGADQPAGCGSAGPDRHHGRHRMAVLRQLQRRSRSHSRLPRPPAPPAGCFSMRPCAASCRARWAMGRRRKAAGSGQGAALASGDLENGFDFPRPRQRQRRCRDRRACVPAGITQAATRKSDAPLITLG